MAMKKGEIEHRLLKLEEKINSLGDLSALIASGATLAALTAQAQVVKNDVETLIPQLTSQKTGLDTLTTEIQQIKTSVAEKNTVAGEMIESLDGLTKKVEELKEQTLQQLGRAASEKLSSSFELVKTDLIKERDKWFKFLAYAVGAVIFLTACIALWQVREHGTLYHMAFLIKLGLTFPVVYGIFFINREYARVRNLIEEYTFKSTIARNFEAYKEILEEAFKDQQASVYQRKLDFMISAVESLYSSPMRNIRLNTKREKEVPTEMLSQLRGLVPDLKKMLGLE